MYYNVDKEAIIGPRYQIWSSLEWLKTLCVYECWLGRPSWKWAKLYWENSLYARVGREERVDIRSELRSPARITDVSEGIEERKGRSLESIHGSG